MNTPIRKYQQEKDYLRHKLFRKMKRRRKALIESAKDAPVRALRRKLGIPKFAEGKEPDDQVFILREADTPSGFADQYGGDWGVLIDSDDPGFEDKDKDGWYYTNDAPNGKHIILGPKGRHKNETIREKGRWSGLSQLAALSNAYRNNPILGAPARLYDSWNNAMDNSIGINPLDIAGLVATLAGASSIRRPLTPKQLSKMSLLELGNYFKANPLLLRDIEVTDNVRKFYNNDVLPRLAKLNKKPLGFTADDLINSLNFKAGNFDRNRYGGYYSSGDNAIVLNDRVLNDPRLLDRVLMHEISHGMYNRAGYTPEVASRLNTTYQFSPEYLAAHPGLQLLAELAAVNTETRGMISMDNGWVTGRALDGIVKNMDPFNLMRYFNGPGSSTYAKDWAKRFLPGLALQRATLSAVANPKDTIASLPKDSIEYKNDKLPGYKSGKVVLNNYTNAKFSDDGTFTDDTTRMFDDFYVTPSGVKTKYGSYTDLNWDRYKQQERFFKTHDLQTGRVKYEPGLELPIIDPVTLIAGGKYSGDIVSDILGQMIESGVKRYIAPMVISSTMNPIIKELTPTERVFAALGKLVPKEKWSGNKMGVAVMKQSPTVKSLASLGVDTDLLSPDDLKQLLRLRKESIQDPHLMGRRAIVDSKPSKVELFDGELDENGDFWPIGGVTFDTKPISKQNSFVSARSDGPNKVPYSEFLDDNLMGIHMIQNYSTYPELKDIVTPRKHVAQDLYNVAIHYLRSSGKGIGLYSGKELLTPQATIKTITPKNYRMHTFPDTGVWRKGDKMQIGDSWAVFEPLSPVIPYKNNEIFNVKNIDNIGNFGIDWSRGSNY